MRTSLLTILLIASVATVADAGSAKSSPLRVMSFNIRYGTARDGENQWDRRREFLVRTIRQFSPDLLGTQETLAFQRDFLAESLPEYDHLGVGRNDGREDGEMMAVYYRRDRFQKLDSGHFWLSETPEQIGSKSWDSSLPRMVTWVRLRDLQQPEAPPIAFLNMHFDHLGQTARLESARLVRRRLTEMWADARLIVTGDFNTDEGSAPYQALFDDIDGQPSPVQDSFRVVHPQRTEDEGTFSGFVEKNQRGPRIDWIGVDRRLKIIGAAIDRTAADGRTPSDHFPVTAIVQESAE